MPKKYSIEAEKEYYRESRSERDALPFDWLCAYIKSSFGHDRFKELDVLDVGAGEGIYSAYLANVEKARHVVAFDLTEHRMRTDYMASSDNLSFVSGDLFNMPFQRQSFDIVFMNLVLHHLKYDFTNALLNIGNVIRPGGKLLAIEPNIYNPAQFLLHWWHKRSRNEGFVGSYKIKSVLQNTGFENISIGYLWKDKIWAKNPLFGSCFFIEANKLSVSEQ